MKKVMVFSDWFAPGFRAGGPIQSLVNLTVHVKEVNFFVVTSDTDHHSTEPYSDITPLVWTSFKPHVQVMYLTSEKANKSVFEQLLREIEPDGVYLNSLFSPKFTLAPMAALRSMRWDKPLIVAPRGMLKPSALAEKAWKKRVFLALARGMKWYKNVRWHATNAEEREEILEHFGRQCAVCVADNLPAPPAANTPRSTKQTPGLRLMCVARISPEKGIEEALRFLGFRDWSGLLRLDFVGAQQNQSFLSKCQSLAAEIKGAQIRFLGERSPHELESMWSDYDFMYLPTRGENFGHAIAESLNHGVPVIISNRTPWRHLSERRVGWDLPLEASSFEAVLNACFEMPLDMHQDLSKSAWEWAKSLHADDARLEASKRLFATPDVPRV